MKWFLLLLLLPYCTSFLPPPPSAPSRRSSPSLSELRLSPPTSLNELRQYVPLIVCTGVIIDILAGQPLLKSITSSINPSNLENVNNASSKTSKYVDPSIPRIDVNSITKQALDQAEGIKGMKEWYDARKGSKEIVVDKKAEVRRSAQLLAANAN